MDRLTSERRQPNIAFPATMNLKPVLVVKLAIFIKSNFKANVSIAPAVFIYIWPLLSLKYRPFAIGQMPIRPNRPVKFWRYFSCNDSLDATNSSLASTIHSTRAQIASNRHLGFGRLQRCWLMSPHFAQDLPEMHHSFLETSFPALSHRLAPQSCSRGRLLQFESDLAAKA